MLLRNYRCGFCALACILAVVFLVPATFEDQTGSVKLTTTVSKTVALSIPRNSIHGDVDVDVVNSGNTVRMTVSGDAAKSPVIRVPLLVRSNSDFKISATFESKTALLTQFSVVDVRGTGNLVAPEAMTNLEIPEQYDLRGNISSENGFSILEVGHPFVVLSGPRVSLGGTLESANNALEITLLIRMKPESAKGWLVHLTFFND